MDPRVLEVRDIRSVIDDKDTGRNALATEALDSMSRRNFASNDNRTAGGDSSGDDILQQRARANETPEVKEAYRQLLEATKGMDPKVVEETLNLASSLAESGIKMPALTAAAAEQAKEQNKAKGDKSQGSSEEEPGLVDPRISGIYQTLLRKFTNPLVIKDVITVGKDLAQIAMSPQGRALISDMKDLIKHFKEA